jgi:hypothetical protein
MREDIEIAKTSLPKLAKSMPLARRGQIRREVKTRTNAPDW